MFKLFKKKGIKIEFKDVEELKQFISLNTISTIKPSKNSYRETVPVFTSKNARTEAVDELVKSFLSKF